MVLAPQAPYYRSMPKRREATNLAPVGTQLGRFVREQRDARGWSQDELAARAGANMTFTSISNIERGKTILPDPPAMIGIAEAFDMHVCDLYVAAGYPEFAVGMIALPRMAAESEMTYPASPAIVDLVRELGDLEESDIAQVRYEVRRRWESRRAASKAPPPSKLHLPEES